MSSPLSFAIRKLKTLVQELSVIGHFLFLFFNKKVVCLCMACQGKHWCVVMYMLQYQTVWTKLVIKVARE